MELTREDLKNCKFAVNTFFSGSTPEPPNDVQPEMAALSRKLQRLLDSIPSMTEEEAAARAELSDYGLDMDQYDLTTLSLPSGQDRHFTMFFTNKNNKRLIQVLYDPTQPDIQIDLL